MDELSEAMTRHGKAKICVAWQRMSRAKKREAGTKHWEAMQ